LALGYGGLAIAGLMAIIALGRIWRLGTPGSASAGMTLLMSAALAAVPAYYVPGFAEHRFLYDVTTDTENPPAFQALAAARKSSSSPIDYPSDALALTQQTLYADLTPVMTARSITDAFDVTSDVVREVDLNVVSAEAPGYGSDDGVIEATDRSLVMGLADDISIRVSKRDGTTRIDVRSAARYPRLDLGRNADRVRMLLRKIQSGIEASVPSDTSDTVAANAQPQAQAVKRPAGTALSGSGSLRRTK
jgi:uncharacterized protein (DUF1499 family)